MRKHLSNALCRARERVSGWARAARDAWQRHLKRMAAESGYEEVFAAVVLAAIDLLGAGARIRWITRQLIVAYVAFLRALEPPAGSDWA